MTKEVIYCDVCGKLIPFGKLRITHPKLVQYEDPKEIDFETWCAPCRDSFYSMFNEWKVQRALNVLSQ